MSGLRRACIAPLALGLAVFLVLTLTSLSVAAHGINGHVHVTGWAIERLPPGELAAFFADPEVREAALFAASFPDSGYAVGDSYGEIAHWPPFLEAYIAYFAENFPPPYDDLETRKHAAFVLGLACHGLQDEIFDTIFLHHIRERDGQGQAEADPGTDAFLFTDGYLRFKPPQWAPIEHLVAVFDRLGHAVDADTLDGGMFRVKYLVIDNFHLIAPRFDADYRPLLPWTAAHYVDPGVPGSLAAEIPATAAFLEAVWQRLHGRFPAAAVVAHPYPDGQRRLMGVEAESAASWITLVLGIGARIGSVNAETVHLEGPDGPVPFTLDHTRWAGDPDDWTRLIQLRPDGDLEPDTEYVVRLTAGIELIDGQVLGGEWLHAFRTPCAAGAEPACPPEPTDGGIDPVDAMVPDAMLDAAVPDAMADVMPDAMDCATLDAMVDVMPPDAAAPDAEPVPPTNGGDGCAAVGAVDSPTFLFVIFLLLATRRRKA